MGTAFNPNSANYYRHDEGKVGDWFDSDTEEGYVSETDSAEELLLDKLRDCPDSPMSPNDLFSKLVGDGSRD